MTGIAVPKYYNPAAVNPLKYAEQVQKRKLLWSRPLKEKKDGVSSFAIWMSKHFVFHPNLFLYSILQVYYDGYKMLNYVLMFNILDSDSILKMEMFYLFLGS